jgi:6-pyruvoyltetrahydropterin/6-carboxytetrahydropterin synthase
MKLGMIEYIDCAHYLPKHQKCGTLHGHTYRIEVTIEGENKSGMIIDFGDLKALLRGILSIYDHKSFNEFLEYPSVENICEMIHRKLAERLHLPYTVRVWEGKGKWAEL